MTAGLNVYAKAGLAGRTLRLGDVSIFIEPLGVKITPCGRQLIVLSLVLAAEEYERPGECYGHQAHTYSHGFTHSSLLLPLVTLHYGLSSHKHLQFM